MSNLRVVNFTSENQDYMGFTPQQPTKRHLENHNNYFQFVQKRRKLSKDYFNSQLPPIQYVEDSSDVNHLLKPQEKLLSRKSVASLPTHRPLSCFGQELCERSCIPLKVLQNKTCYCSPPELCSGPTRYGISDNALHQFQNSVVSFSSVYSPTRFHSTPQQTMTNNNDYFSRNVNNESNTMCDHSSMNVRMIPVNVSNNTVRNLTVNDHPDAPENDNQEFSILNIIPSLISEKHRKAAFVENLVDTACLIVEVIWANFSVSPSAKIISLRVFIQETLRRSRTSYSTLQTALFYLIRIKSEIAKLYRCTEYLPTPTSEYPPNVIPNSNQNNDPATCGRRMFLAALIVASKYLQDRNYSNRAWSKMSGLSVKEINTNEICFLKLIDYNLFIAETNFKRWSSLLLTNIQAISGPDMSNPEAFRVAKNRRKVDGFRETLKFLDPVTMECERAYPITPAITPTDSAPGSPNEQQPNMLKQMSFSSNLSSTLQALTGQISDIPEHVQKLKWSSLNYDSGYNYQVLPNNNYENNLEGCQDSRIKRILVRSFA
ncbi:6511_t:CDS:2 [Dentiscutata erythropus]|uniref:6511_t:CDS:1 n=1 Tax=Dentiscutata erythropus TaxID=1348616 RepID=A0A9N9E424_9GLOM|nr:6511_t:CDS:2 [Dentiscutata erythropus]